MKWPTAAVLIVAMVIVGGTTALGLSPWWAAVGAIGVAMGLTLIAPP
jgi:hypothetical protein